MPALTNKPKTPTQINQSKENPLKPATSGPSLLTPKKQAQTLTDPLYKVIKRAVSQSADPKTSSQGRIAFRQYYNNLSDAEKRQFSERYTKETGRSFAPVLFQLLSGNTLQIVDLGQKAATTAGGPKSTGRPQPFIGPTIPTEKVSIKNTDWLSNTKEFKLWTETLMVTGQGAMIEGVRRAQGGLVAHGLEKPGQFFQQTGYGLYITGEILEIASLTQEAVNTNADPSRLRHAIVCLTVKTEITTLSAELGGMAGAATGPVAPIAAPAGAILFGLVADKSMGWVINQIDWCKL